MDRQVFARFDELAFLPVKFQAAALGVPGPRVIHLLVADRLGNRAVVHQGGNTLQGLRLQILDLVSLGVGGMVEYPLQIHVGAALAHELPVILEARVARLLRQLGRNQGQHVDITHRVEDPRSGVRGKICRKGLVTDAVMSGCFNSAQQSTPKTTSAHSHEVDHHHSLTAIISIRGSTFTTVL